MIMEMEEEVSSWKERIKVIRKIGNGCQGQVFSVEDVQSRQRYALKVIQVRKQLKDKERQRIKFQVQSNLFLSNQVLSNHFPRMLDYWLEEQSINILFELCEENAEVGFGRLKGYSERYNYMIVLLFDGLQALSILEKVNIIHRDIKPENILRNEDSFKLADLGLSRVYESGSTLTNDIGNKLGRSPQFSSGLYSTKSDIWSLGVHCFYLMENILPFDERSLLMIKNNPNEIEKVVSSGQLEVNLQISGRKSKNVLSFIHLVLAEMIVLNPDCRLSAPQLIEGYFSQTSIKSQSRIRFCLFRYLQCRETLGECYLMILLAEVQLNRASSKMKEDAQSNKRKICIKIKETLLRLLDLTRRQLLSKFQEPQIIDLFESFTQEWSNSLIREDGKTDCLPLKSVEQALQIYKISKVRQKFPLIQWIVRLYRVLELRAAGKRCKKVLLWQIPIDLYKLI